MLQDLVPLFLALLLGGAIGLEREWHGRPAGLRTHSLVCLTSTMLIGISFRIGPDDVPLGEVGRLVLDPNRMGAGIVTGIGFLGAATVLRSGDLLRGLTTAACIWFVAGLGIVLGNRDYALAIAATAISLLVLTLLNRMTDVIHPIVYRRLVVRHDREEAEAVTTEIGGVLKEEGLRVLDVAAAHEPGGQHELIFYLSLKNEQQSPRVTRRVAGLDGVTSAAWKLIGTSR
jgi:putative Mg2+ transporter-C (MgtC) family protein